MLMGVLSGRFPEKITEIRLFGNRKTGGTFRLSGFPGTAIIRIPEES
jgi:hypothetical protein